MQFLPHLFPSILLRSVLCFGLVGLFWSCSSSSQEESQATLAPFFDLEAYVDAEVSRLEADDTKVEKTLVLNGKTETIQPEAVDLSKELVLLRNADINRPAWLDKYEVDSTMVQDRLQQLSYKALEPELRTQSLIIDYDEQGTVKEIKLNNKMTTFLSEAEVDISYQPAEGMLMNSKQTNKSSDPIALSLQLRFLPK